MQQQLPLNDVVDTIRRHYEARGIRTGTINVVGASAVVFFPAGHPLNLRSVELGPLALKQLREEGNVAS